MGTGAALLVGASGPGRDLATPIDHLRCRPPRDRTEVHWPGDEMAVDWLRELREDWPEVLDRLADSDLDADAPFRGPPDQA